jgi:hypothetical protein
VICPNCQHPNEGGNFCENCGTKLISQDNQATTVIQQQQQPNPVHIQAQPNPQLENAKKVSKMYFQFFLSVLKSPYTASQKVFNEDFINGIITFVLFALAIPLTIYIGLGDTTDFMDNAFITVVIKPAFGYFVLLLLISTYILAVLKLGKVSVSFKDIVARFGSFLIPFVAAILVGVLLALMDSSLFAVFLFLGFAGSMMFVPTLLVASYKKAVQGGLDALYGTILVYIAITITFIIMSALLFAKLLESLEDALSFLSFF